MEETTVLAGQPALVMHECRRCARPFPYRYDGRYDPDHLVEVDYICMACFHAFIHERDVAHCA